MKIEKKREKIFEKIRCKKKLKNLENNTLNFMHLPTPLDHQFFSIIYKYNTKHTFYAGCHEDIILLSCSKMTIFNVGLMYMMIVMENHMMSINVCLYTLLHNIINNRHKHLVEHIQVTLNHIWYIIRSWCDDHKKDPNFVNPKNLMDFL